MERPVLPDEVRAALPPIAQDYIAWLESRGRKHSQNSSLPPSKDPLDAPTRPVQERSGRLRGGQPGHPGHHRMMVAPDVVVDHYPAACPGCQRLLGETCADAAEPRRQQVWDLPPPPRPVVTEHRYHTVACPDCGTSITADRPVGVPDGAFGPEVTALVGLLHGRYRLSAREIVALLDDLWRMPIGLGSVPELWRSVGDALAEPYAEAHAAVAASPRLNVDETRWNQAGATRWLWTAVGAVSTVFIVAATRAKIVLVDLIGPSYGGIVGSDRYYAYKSIPVTQRQACWAHIKRNLAEVAGWGGPCGAWGNEALAEVAHLFGAWHRFRDGTTDRLGLQADLKPIQIAFDTLLHRGESDLPSTKAQGLCADLLSLWPALWTFSTTDGIEPTNNAAEHAIRPAVLWRKGCFGADSDDGNLFVERILTVIATCRQQQRALLPFLSATVRAHVARLPPPPLIQAPVPA